MYEEILMKSRIVVFIFIICGIIPIANAGDNGNKHIVFVVGDDEYRSEITMPLMAKILEEQHGFKCSMTYAMVPETGEKIPQYRQNIEGLEALKEADLAVFYLRFRRLPDEQMDLILNYVNSGKPMIGLRTTTHAFRFPEGHKYQHLNADFGIDVFGQKWIHHPGGSTRIVKNLADHPIMRGMPDEFWMLGDLYEVVPLHGDCVPLMTGYALDGHTEFVTDDKGEKVINRNRKAGRYPPSPVVWTKTYKGARVFFTTMGHPKDFANLPVRRLLVNAVYWSLGMEDEIPPQGHKAAITGTFDAPDLSEAGEYHWPPKKTGENGD
jgi:type 1 glutamine amidotransferase